jgi:RNA polymerase sigma factor (sigma-70 family)
MKTHEEVTRAIDKYADTVQRICYLHTKNEYDSDDIFQNVFLKYMTKSPPFKDEEHEKAWIIRVAINLCKDSFKSFFKKNVCPIDEIKEMSAEETEDLSFVREAVKKLPENYRDVVFLFYYEGYSAIEISSLLKKNVNTIYTWLKRAKDMLKNELGGVIIE